MLRLVVVAAAFFSSIALVACESPAPTPTDAGGGPDSGAPLDAGPDVDAFVPMEDGGVACETAADDYTPRVSMSSTDTWPACVSDDGVYHMIDAAGLSSQARVAAFEALFGEGGTLAYEEGSPAAADFTTGRTLYAEPGGLGSRVNRRTDEHYAPVSGTCTSGTTMLSGCQCPEVAAASPEYCVGPGTLLPIVQRSFRAGQTGGDGEPLRVHAARLHAALAWFLAISPYKESLTCTPGATAKDCDSAWAYYTGLDETGAGDRDGNIGLAAMIEPLDREAHDRIWDGLLAVRCWRDLDRGTPASGATFGDATMPALRDRARAQLDRAMMRGVAAVAIDRLRRYEAASGEDRAVELAFLRTWLRPIDATTLEVIDESTGTVSATYDIDARPSLFDRALRAASPEDADFVAAQLSMAEPSDVDGVVAALRRAFPCP